ncbi:Ig-like domain-containing protein [Halobacterium litoreum]|uniref:Ig-like domain-containing protein n=1 Tax=Halobacterium litoreum TaxID=2039234 RepID=A0ABD5NFN8_9EURY|nr:Ig-like domain-containing protein [Halobacterium litoreum]UHH12970.1 Ig-like domain-containing protein [Halobacterium litoreum]
MFDPSPYLPDSLHYGAFATDERAIEGLPVRLVIAFVVGVATLSVMLSMVSGVNTLGVSELDAKPSPDVVTPGDQTIDVTAVDADGDPVSGATVVVKAGTADVDGVATATTGDDGVATLDVAPELGPNQAEGTLKISLKPPAGTEYVDRRENTAVLVVAD